MVGRVTFPVFSTIQDDPARLKKGLQKALTMMVLVNFPMMIGLAYKRPKMPSYRERRQKRDLIAQKGLPPLLISCPTLSLSLIPGWTISLDTKKQFLIQDFEFQGPSLADQGQLQITGADDNQLSLGRRFWHSECFPSDRSGPAN
jgi:hypothetical protein